MSEQHDAHVRAWEQYQEEERKLMEADLALDRHLQRIEDSYFENEHYGIWY